MNGDLHEGLEAHEDREDSPVRAFFVSVVIFAIIVMSRQPFRRAPPSFSRP